ncbi:hypothetical protein DSO57_1038962, partial [Entomophthora muscae]
MIKRKPSPSSEILPTVSPPQSLPPAPPFFFKKNQVFTTHSTLFTKAIQGAAKHKYKASELSQQLDFIATALLEGSKMKRGKKDE